MRDAAIPEATGILPPGTPEEFAGPSLAPVRLSQRFPTLDCLRGFALLGILMMNIDDFAGPEGMWDIPIGMPKAAFTGWHAHLDIVLVTLRWLFGEGRMRSLFSMLFGAGVVLLTERLEGRRPGHSPAGIYYRRNLWLLLFGLCHGFLIWWGDILVDYSVMALVFLYPLRRLSTRPAHTRPGALAGGRNLWQHTRNARSEPACGSPCTIECSNRYLAPCAK